MSETNILAEYSQYLQRATVELDNNNLLVLHHSANILLNYKQFKDYYIRGLTGKDNYLEEMVSEWQFRKANLRD